MSYEGPPYVFIFGLLLPRLLYYAWWIATIVLLDVAVALAAKRLNRSAVGYFLLSSFFTPVVGAAFLIALGPHTRASIEGTSRSGELREPTLMV